MTKKHFIQLAAALKFARSEIDGHTAPIKIMDELIEDIGLICARTNSNFDKARFRAASDWKKS